MDLSPHPQNAQSPLKLAPRIPKTHCPTLLTHSSAFSEISSSSESSLSLGAHQQAWRALHTLRLCSVPSQHRLNKHPSANTDTLMGAHLCAKWNGMRPRITSSRSGYEELPESSLGNKPKGKATKHNCLISWWLISASTLSYLPYISCPIVLHFRTLLLNTIGLLCGLYVKLNS